MQKKKVTLAEILVDVHQGLTCENIRVKYGISVKTIQNRFKEIGFKPPKGFYVRVGKVVGRPKGIPMSETRKREHRARMLENNPFKGKKHTEGSLDKMRGRDPSISGENNPFLRAVIQHPELRKQSSKRKKEWWANLTAEELESLKAKISYAQATSQYHKNFSSVKKHKHGHLELPKCGRVFYRSSWEEKVFTYLDSDDRVLKFSVESTCVQYVDASGNFRHTRVDVEGELVSGVKFLLEIKPLALVERSKLKLMAAEQYARKNGWLFILVTSVSNLEGVFNVFG